MDCSTNLAVVCGRREDSKPVCSSGPWTEGQVIVSPGYPYDASVPCDYILSVETGKRVKLELQILEANSCCDRLILTDNLIGGNIIANLTGALSNRTYTTDSSNLMTVSWQPQGGLNVRGMMITFTGV
ncbi:hypothetical protein PRIPAC_83283 [Pristionchus pacificus]|nr:hypothetical protein PRIPAC_83283 [Pristionchus pacificus]